MLNLMLILLMMLMSVVTCYNFSVVFELITLCVSKAGYCLWSCPSVCRTEGLSVFAKSWKTTHKIL